MRIIFTAILFAAVTYLSSCSKKDDGSTNLLVVPSVDSITKNSDIKIVFSNIDSVETHDLTVKNLPVEYLFASNIYDPSDTTYVTKIILTDNTSKQISLNVTAKNTVLNPTVYTVVTNSSTLTDFRLGENKTYAIGVGSTLTVTQATYPIEGTMQLILRYNMVSTTVTGTFSIYHQ